MNNEEVNKVLEELHEVRPEKLNDKAKRLFEAIMKIADERDMAKADFYEANNRINDLLDIVKQKKKMIDWLVEEIYSIVNLGEFIDFNINKIDTKEEIKKYFEERCKNE